MAKIGKRERHRQATEPLPDLDALLFKDGLTVSDDFISEEGLIGFTSASGRDYDLMIHDTRLFNAALEKLRALGVKPKTTTTR